MNKQATNVTSIVSDGNLDIAVELLERFFREEGFATPRDRILHNLRTMVSSDSCAAFVTIRGREPCGVCSISTILYVEWGLLGEIGDLYVSPDFRGSGVARGLMEQAIDWCRQRGCSAVAVTITEQGERAHGLSSFYARFGFRGMQRAGMTLRL